MNNEYYKRYKKNIPLRNPLEIFDWLPYTIEKWEINDAVSFQYIGRLALPNIDTLLRFCIVFDSLNKTGRNIKSGIFSIDNNHLFVKKTESF